MARIDGIPFDVNVVTLAIFAAICGFIVYRVLTTIHELYFSPLADVPGPWHTAVSRAWLTWNVMAGRRIFAVHEMHMKYGPFVRISPTEIAIADLDSLRRIYSPSEPYRKSDWYLNMTGGTDSIFALVHNDAHRYRRKAYGNAFSNSNITMLEPVVRRHVQTCVSKVKRDLEGGGPVNVMQWLHLMAADINGEVSYGKDFGQLENEADSPFVQDLTAITMIGGIRAEFPTIVEVLQSAARLIPLPAIQWLAGCHARVNEYGNKAIAELQREVQHCKDDNPRPSLFTKLIDGVDDPTVKYRLTMQEIAHEATNNIIAGSETVTITSTYLLWVIYRHPEVRAKLLSEFATVDGEVTDEKLQGLEYLRLVIKETLRLYAAAQMGLPRVVPAGGRQLGPYFLPAGTEVTIQGYTMHRDPDVFEEPFLFKPERWVNATREMEASILSWGGASRSCLGQNLAMMELRLIAAAMLTTCPDAELAASCTDESMEFENYFVVMPKSHKLEIQVAQNGNR
ncbi:Cytochrome P450 monooxygenase orf2 [Drechslerella dactyloides]|uniref:Cytochrome P450 monooxygenase orf2 n=1 Tax=Drechslerella dactyloides TaxID=74499 RepID=A0AAD6NH21_DREDA|nr:Cytochrome P450 monooxygenase orf2 [Drechslerella dactyloides]